MDEATGPADWSSVIVSGYYQELPEPQFPDEPAHARQLVEKRHRWWLNALAERPIKVTDQSIEPLFFRIRVESSSGLRAVSDDESDSRQKLKTRRRPLEAQAVIRATESSLKLQNYVDTSLTVPQYLVLRMLPIR